MIVDCHSHLFNRKDFISIYKGYMRYESEKRDSDRWIKDAIAMEEATSVDKWIDSMDRYGVDKVIIAAGPSGARNDTVADFVKERPDRFAALADIDFVDPVKSESVREVERCIKELGMKGIGEIKPQHGSIDLGDEKFFPIYEKAQELGVPIMIHFGSSVWARYADLRYANPLMLDPALRNFPDLNFIACHMAGDYVGQLFVLMQCRPNLYTDFGHVPTPWRDLLGIDPRSILRKFLDKVGADRLLWEMDVGAPYFSDMYKSRIKGTINDNPFVKLLDDIGVGEKEKAKILGDNAVRMFNL